MLLWLATGCAPPPCPGFPGEIPVSHGTPGDWSDLDAFVVAEMEAACIPALSVSLVDADGLRFSGAYGWAELDPATPMTPNTPMMMASASKMVVALAAALAEDDGALSLSDPIGEHLPFPVDNPRLSGEAPIRLWHLATHSSSIIDNWDVLDPTYRDGDPERSLAPFLESYLTPTGDGYSASRNFARWAPGQAWYYSNVGAALTALAVEEAVGEPFDAFTARRLFVPLGMADTRWFLSDYPEGTVIARPYSFTPSGQWQPIAHYGFSTWPDGQLRSTAEDMGALLTLALSGGGAVASEAAVSSMLREPQPSLSRWYLSTYLVAQRIFWFDMMLEGRRIIGHDGDDYGVSTEVFYDPAAKLGVSVLMSLSDGERDGAPRAATIAIQQRLFALGEQQ